MIPPRIAPVKWPSESSMPSMTMSPMARIGFLGSLREIHVSKLLLGRRLALKESIGTFLIVLRLFGQRMVSGR